LKSNKGVELPEDIHDDSALVGEEMWGKNWMQVSPTNSPRDGEGEGKEGNCKPDWEIDDNRID